MDEFWIGDTRTVRVNITIMKKLRNTSKEVLELE